MVADPVHAGMLRVNPAGEFALLGSNDSDARPNEKPQMAVKLDYRYSLAVQEVTCGDYAAMAKREGREIASSCDSDSLPVVDVTFYDAVLYANARSKAEGYDTVYSYVGKSFSRNNRCVHLDGLVFHHEVEGYRLPTEAEWVYAASKGWNPAGGWNASNSDGRMHQVCTSEVDEFGFCDLAGNVLEWVNDWLGPLKDTTIVNYIGASQPNDLEEKVVKGGYYSNSPEGMTLYSRGSTYSVSPVSAESYLGFRLAFGSIPDACSSAGDGNGLESTFFIEAPVESIKKWMGTYRSVLAFRNHESGNLCFLDYRKNVLNVVEISDSIQVYHPDISPDGSKVAFCTVPEGTGGKSSVYVRNLDAEGSRLVKLDVESAAIPRWYVDEHQDTSIIYVDNAGDNSDEAEFLKANTWKVPFQNGTFGKPEKILSGAYHGGVFGEGSFAVSGSRLLRAFVEGEHKVWYDEKQACNVSLSKDGASKTLFLDFGGKDASGEKYGVHDRLLVVDSSGQMIHSIPAPDGYSFDHTEWTNREDLAVASLTNFNGVHKTLALVNLRDSSVMDLVSGTEVWHPCFWAKPRVAYDGDVLDVDSAGIYLGENYDENVRLFSLKMRMFWDLKDEVELVALGTSRTEKGLDPRELSMPALNMGRSGGELWENLHILANYVLPQMKNMKYLVLEVSPDLLQSPKNFRFEKVFDQAVGFQYDANHDFWRDSVPRGFVDIVDEYCPYSRKDSVEMVSTRGLLEMEPEGWGSTISSWDSVFCDECELSRIASLDSIRDVVEGTKETGLQIIALIYPQSPLYRESGRYGHFGLQRSVAKVTVDFLDSLAKAYPHFTLMDENKFGDHDYGDEMASDDGHLSKLGAIKLTRRLDSLISYYL
ncbi:TIGR02171 family protein [Fibrobacter sp. UWEL]|nr:TIGR02171 family protein [Fibrobacter sp. UWEL]